MGFVDRVRRFLRGADAGSEAESQRDGLLSYASEWHALLAGGAAGVVAAFVETPELAVAAAVVALGWAGADRFRGRGVASELQREPWYGIGGVALGYVLGYALAAVAAAGVV